jgi:hypothetical protein
MVQVSLYDQDVELLHKAQYESLRQFFETALSLLEDDQMRQIALVQISHESDEQ